MKNIEFPKPEMTDYLKAQFATEVAFAALVKRAKEMGLPVEPVMGLMYLPTQEMTQAFIEACRTILMAISPSASRLTDSKGKDHWIGESLD